MNLKKSFLLLVLLFSFLLVSAQEKAKSELFDEFGKVGNDDLLGRYDPFLNALRSSDTQGYVIIYDDKNDPLEKYLYERRIENCRNRISRDYKNLHFDFGKNDSRLKVQFWLAPANAGKPVFDELPRNFKLQNFRTPKLVDSSIYEEDYCPLNLDLKFYSVFLKANPNLRGKIIIGEKDFKKYISQRNKYLNELLKYGVKKRQLLIVRNRDKYSPKVEFWYIPNKN